MSAPPSTVSFLFTDIEGSTRLWQQDEEAMRTALSRHDELLRTAVADGGGAVFSSMGDGIAAAFPSANAAVAAAIRSQRLLESEPWPTGSPIRVRMGIHTGEAEFRNGDYFGTTVNRAARLMAIGHGGQVLLSSATAELLGDSVTLVDLGGQRLRDLDLPMRVFQVGEGSFPPLRSLDAYLGNLPVQVTSFVGRDREIAEIAAQLRSARLVTLTGVGGVGKTRLALQVALEVIDDFPEGAWLSEFAPVSDPGAVWETLAASLQVQPFSGRTIEEAVLGHLSSRRLLLVLDNCEHLLGSIARMVDRIAQRCSGVTILATSREGLGVGGERIVAVPSLGIPAAEDDPEGVLAADAVRLFSERASAAKSDFSLTDRNSRAIVELCRRLDGIPLAIELAAASVRSLTPEDLVARLDQRFKLLTRGSRAALERQQTLRATLDWSYDLLDDAERRGLDRLSVFAGGCDLAGAEAVLADVDLDSLDIDDVLGRLVDKSLVVADVTDAGVRYRLLETIRQYVQEQLEASGDTAEIRHRHADHFVELAEAAGPHLWTRDQLEWNDVVWRDIDNLRAAFDWAIETPSPDHALRLVAPLAVDTRIGDVAMEWAAVAIQIPGAGTHELFPAVVAWASWGAAMAGDAERAEELITIAEEAQQALSTQSWSILRNRATVYYARRDYEETLLRAEEWVRQAREHRNDLELAHSLPLLGAMLAYTNQIDEAVATLEEAVQVGRKVGQFSSLGFSLAALMQLLPKEDSERASALLDEAMGLAEEINSPSLIFGVQGSRGWIALSRGDCRTALSKSVECAELLLEIGWIVAADVPFLLAGIALCQLDRPEPAAVLIGAARSLSEHPAIPSWALEILARTDESLLESLGEQRLAALAARGEARGCTTRSPTCAHKPRWRSVGSEKSRPSGPVPLPIPP